MKNLYVFLLIALASDVASAQSPRASTKGAPAATHIVASRVRDRDQLNLYNSFQVLGEKLVGKPSGQLRVIGTWGESAGLDCDCVLTRVSIAMNYDGEDLRLYRLGQLLDPKVDSIATEGGSPVAYIAYGEAATRKRARIEVLSNELRITEAPPR
jgi:hypothetical protein